MEVRLLGELSVRDGDGHDATPTAPKERVLVALLALRAGRVVRTSEAIDALWGEHPPASAVESVQTLVARLRRRLGAGSIVGVSGGYRWNGEPMDVDALRFEALLDEAGNIARTAGVASAGPALDAALAAWQGAPAWDEDVGEELRSTAARLNERIEVAHEDREQARLEAGDPGTVVARLEGLVAKSPLRERRWALLMEALYQCGRQADALRAFQRARAVLGEVGLEPTQRLVDLEARIVGHHGALGRSPPRPSGRPRRARVHLIGRDGDIERISSAILPGALVTITGAAGVGKTSLVRAVMDRVEHLFPDGAFWADLAAIAHADEVAQALADAVGVMTHTGTPLLRVVAAALEGRRALVVLDNCEHVRTGAAEVAEALEELGTAAMLATSRERVGLEDETVMPLNPLDADGLQSPAVQLLAERVRNGSARASGADLERLADIAVRLDGVPLALELAAARCRTLGIAEVAARIGDAVGLLGDATRPTARHQTLERALGWSYRLLTEAERRVLERLSVFAGPFTLDAAEDVAADPSMSAADVDDAVATLVEHSLVHHDDATLRMLEITRQFGARRLAESHGTDAAWTALSSYIARRVPVIHAGLRSPHEADWIDQFDGIWADVRAVVRRGLELGDADLVITILVHLGQDVLYRRPEALAWVEQAVARWGDRPGPHRHELLALGAYAAFTHTDPARAVALADAAVDADPAPGTAIDCLPESARFGAYHFAGQLDHAAGLARQSLETFPPDGHPADRACIATVEALVRMSANEPAVAEVDRAVELAMESGNPSAIAYALIFQGTSLNDSDNAGAVITLRRARSIAASVRNMWLVDLAAQNLASVHASRDAQGALEEFIDVVDDSLRRGWITHAWLAMWNVPPVLHRLGRPREAMLVLGGCEASGVDRLPRQPAPDDLIRATETHDGGSLSGLRKIGRGLPLAELIDIVLGRRPLPLT